MSMLDEEMDNVIRRSGTTRLGLDFSVVVIRDGERFVIRATELLLEDREMFNKLDRAIERRIAAHRDVDAA